ncbi:MAG: hypothetical protein HeimC3_31580 [Candidatus Heimdallarchaeota archaeon LC_3]|nr:MAG: hypothetical protein HeimC3_31580 [Candidatus Heimdallarchaeota archaeon LC_3]
MINKEVVRMNNTFDGSFQDILSGINRPSENLFQRIKKWGKKNKVIREKYHLDHYLSFLVLLNASDDIINQK